MRLGNDHHPTRGPRAWSRLARAGGIAARMGALLGTTWVLVATSPPDDFGRPAPQCIHPRERVTFEVAGTCGPKGTIVVTSETDDCAVWVQGAAAVGLPSGGRFTVQSGTTRPSLLTHSWSLSGYWGELPADGGAQQSQLARLAAVAAVADVVDGGDSDGQVPDGGVDALAAEGGVGDGGGDAGDGGGDAGGPGDAGQAQDGGGAGDASPVADAGATDGAAAPDTRAAAPDPLWRPDGGFSPASPGWNRAVRSCTVTPGMKGTLNISCSTDQAPSCQGELRSKGEPDATGQWK